MVHLIDELLHLVFILVKFDIHNSRQQNNTGEAKGANLIELNLAGIFLLRTLNNPNMTLKYYSILLIISVYGLINSSLQAQTSYFPPLIGNDWTTEIFQNFPYDMDYTDSLHDYLQSKGSKAFIVLHDGKIVDDTYFGTFTQDSFWYWASCGKSLTAF